MALTSKKDINVQPVFTYWTHKKSPHAEAVYLFRNSKKRGDTILKFLDARFPKSKH